MQNTTKIDGYGLDTMMTPPQSSAHHTEQQLRWSLAICLTCMVLFRNALCVPRLRSMAGATNQAMFSFSCHAFRPFITPPLSFSHTLGWREYCIYHWGKPYSDLTTHNKRYKTKRVEIICLQYNESKSLLCLYTMRPMCVYKLVFKNSAIVYLYGP